MSIEPRLCHACGEDPASERTERQLRWVVALTTVTMLGELTAGIYTGSLALVAEGWHMACHAGALGISAMACWFARTRARHAAFTFGTGKIHALAGYTNALLLLGVAAITIAEAARRLSAPVTIDVRDALPVAIVGLIVNAACVGLLHQHEAHEEHHGHNHNVRAAYLHVLGDLVTSLAAILALLGTRYARLPALDPLMAIVSSLVVLRWGLGLCRSSSGQLLDVLSSSEHADAIRRTIESIDDTRVVDLHLWALGPQQRGCIVSIMTSQSHSLDHYREAIRAVAPVEHLTIEVAPCYAPNRP